MYIRPNNQRLTNSKYVGMGIFFFNVVYKITVITIFTALLFGTSLTGLSIKTAQAGDPIYYMDWEWNRFIDLDEYPTTKYPQWLENKQNIQDKNDVYDAISWEIYKGDPPSKKDKALVKEMNYYHDDYNLIGGHLRLTDKITRAEFAAALARTIGINVSNGNPWYINYVKELNKLGIIPTISGDWSDTSFITREEMGQWIGRAAKKFNIKIQNENVYFTDTNDENILLAAKTGIIKGSGNNQFKPQDNAQRVEAALMLIRMVKNMEFNIAKPTDEQIKTFLLNYAKALYNKQTMKWGNETEHKNGFVYMRVVIHNNSLIKPYMTDLGLESVKYDFSAWDYKVDPASDEYSVKDVSIKQTFNNGKFIRVKYVSNGIRKDGKKFSIFDGIMYILNDGKTMKISFDGINTDNIPDYIIDKDTSDMIIR